MILSLPLHTNALRGRFIAGPAPAPAVLRYPRTTALL